MPSVYTQASTLEVTTVKFNRHSEKAVLTDHFTYKKRGRFDILQKLCFSYLTKIRAFATVHKDFYSTVHINHKNVFAMVEAQIRGLHNAGKKPYRIYIGRDTFMELYGHPDFPLYCNFDLPMKVAARCGEVSAIAIRNLPVTVLPNFIGVLVVPHE